MISMIVAMDENRAIGKEGNIPWSIPEDLKYFKRKTVGHTVIMGRRTYESIGGPLTGRDNIILSKNKNYKVNGCRVESSVKRIIKRYIHSKEEIFIIGGEIIYKEFIQFTSKLYITLIAKSIKNTDTFFPKYSEFKIIFKEENYTKTSIKYSFLELIRQ